MCGCAREKESRCEKCRGGSCRVRRLIENTMFTGLTAFVATGRHATAEWQNLLESGCISERAELKTNKERHRKREEPRFVIHVGHRSLHLSYTRCDRLAPSTKKEVTCFLPSRAFFALAILLFSSVRTICKALPQCLL